MVCNYSMRAAVSVNGCLSSALSLWGAMPTSSLVEWPFRRRSTGIGSTPVLLDWQLQGSLEGATETAGAIRDLGRRTAALAVDVTNWDQVTAMVEQAVAALGSIDIAFNVPGINVRKVALEMTPAEFPSVIDVNLIGVFHCAKAIDAHAQASRAHAE